jgi:N-carbamoylputrescine amidase
MRITACQLPDAPGALAEEWPRLSAHLDAQRSDLLVLPELPFHRWHADRPEFSREVWDESMAAHRRWLARLAELPVRQVAGTMPLEEGGRRYNVGFVWDRERGLAGVHRKHYLPEMAGFHEATWFDRGPRQFEVASAGQARLGFAICTELWAMDLARHYGRQAVHLLLTPRATGCDTVEKWLAAGRSAGVVAGAFSISSNRYAPERDFGGGGWITDPDGAILAHTSTSEPFLTVDCPLGAAETARRTYPRDALARDDPPA